MSGSIYFPEADGFSCSTYHSASLLFFLSTNGNNLVLKMMIMSRKKLLPLGCNTEVLPCGKSLHKSQGRSFYPSSTFTSLSSHFTVLCGVASLHCAKLQDFKQFIPSILTAPNPFKDSTILLQSPWSCPKPELSRLKTSQIIHTRMAAQQGEVFMKFNLEPPIQQLIM